MPTIMADHDIEGQMQVLLRLFLSPDATLWRLCQTHQIVLLTGNRNQDGPASLEAVIQEANTPASLPVLTIGEPQRIFRSSEYARRVTERLLEYLVDLDNLRGTGRLYLP